MKTNSLILLILIILVLSCKHNDKKDNQFAKSRIGVYMRDRKWAEEEFKHDIKDKFMLISVGIALETDDYFWAILKDEYKIEKKFGVGCMVDDGVTRYNDLMDKEINKRYGTDFYKKVHVKIDSICKIDQPLIRKVKELSSISSLNILKFKVFSTPDDNVKVVSGFGWRNIDKKIWYTNLFRVTLDRRDLKIKNVDTTAIGVEPFNE